MSCRDRSAREFRLAPVCAVLFACLGAAAAARAAGQAAIENPAVAEAIVEAQKLAAKKQWEASLAAVRKAQAVPDKSAYADYKINEFLAYLLTQQRKYVEAAQVFEKMISSGQTPQDKRDDHIKTIAQLYFNAERYPKAVEYAQRGLESQPNSADLLLLAGQAQYLSKQYDRATATMKRLVAVTENAGRKPEESWLQVILDSAHRRNDEAAASDVLRTLLRYYPQHSYWERLFSRKNVRDYPPPLKLGYYRLMLDVGVLRSETDIEEMALSAIDAGAPAEAVRVLEWARSQNLIAAASRARFERMLRFAQGKVADSSPAYAQLKEAARAAKTGQADATLGRAYLDSGQYDEAVAALQRAVKKGELVDPDEVRTNLAIAYLNADQLKQARSTVAAIDPKSEWHDLATLWILRHDGEKA